MINKVTITGADTKIDPKIILELSKKYPFVEWGILISRARIGTNRYPTLEWIKKLCFLKQLSGENVNLSLHVCGKMCQDILNGDMPSELMEDKFPLALYFDRMQLNFNLLRSKLDLVKFISILDKLNNKIIFQYNNPNKTLLDVFIQYGDPKFNYLYDASGGRGITGDWVEPLSAYTGYAGGLNPENLKQELDKIRGVVSDQTIWIDAETGVRTDDEFDLNKVIAFLEIAKEYVVE